MTYKATKIICYCSAILFNAELVFFFFFFLLALTLYISFASLLLMWIIYPSIS